MILVWRLYLIEYLEEEMTAEQKRWQFWAFLELFCVASLILSAVLHNLIYFLSPGKIYQYYFTMSLRNEVSAEEIGKLWKNKKLR